MVSPVTPRSPLLRAAALALLACALSMAPTGGAVRAQEAAADEGQEEAPARAEPARKPVPTKPAPRSNAAAAKPPARPAVAQAQTAPSVGQPQPVASGLPNGASAINEIFGDWTVDCRVADGQKSCLLSQAQGNNQTGQRVFAIELRAPKNGRAEGTILMPFGLKLENGAILRLDDKDLGQGLRFSTCVPSGCLLPISFPTVATDAMKTGKVLTAAALNLSNNDPVAFNISLNGFSAALTRLVQLDG